MRERLETLLRQMRARPRLMFSGVMVLVVFALTRTFSPPTRWLLAWDVGAGLYQALALLMMVSATPSHMRARARAQDDGAIVVLTITLSAAIASVAAIAIELAGIKNYPAARQGLHMALAVFTIACSWCFVHTIFALHYAYEYYVSPVKRGQRTALEFPESPEPDYFDFMYFAFVIGTTSQTADVSIVSRTMRRLALIHGIVAFFFNTTLLALTVNIAASML